MLDLRRRVAAIGALLALALALVVAVVALRSDLVRMGLCLVLVISAAVAGWYVATRRGALRAAGSVVALVSVALIVVVTLRAEHSGLAIVALVALVGLSTSMTRFALGRDRRSVKEARAPGVTVGPARHGSLIVNPKSGGGKAERFGIVDEARRRGVEPIVLGPGDDLLQLAERAIEGGADVIGMAGGDGSQALVASVAMRHDVAHVCIPAGTRNHFALDVGLDRDDVVGALDAFGDAIERRIDLAEVGGRVFVNNASLGVYAKIVQSPEYRDAKRQTTAALLPELLGPDAEPFSLRFVGPDNAVHESPVLVLVSNNPYVVTRFAGFGTRARLDTGQLGISAVEVRGPADVSQLVAAEAAGQLQRYHGFLEWSAGMFTLDSDGPVEVGIDGEALLLPPPLEFRSLPGAVRLRLPRHAPGRSPAALSSSSPWWTVRALSRAVAGRATPIDETSR
ncbi:MAG TPA: diacylglycerol kinase family protein [Acidimicrobiia bacterium]